MKNSLKLVLLGVLGLFVFTLDLSAAEKTQDVFVSILPQEYFVKRIGGDRVKVTALVQPGSSPATYEPTSQQLAGLAEAELYFRIGVPFENGFISKIKGINDNLQIIDTRKGIKLRTMEKHHHGAGSEEHSSDEKHHNAVKDPHIWLNPINVKIQARTIADALVSVDPEGKSIYEGNYVDFCKDLDKLNKYIADTLMPLKGKILMVFHPAWGYFADQYGLKQHAIEIEGKNPAAKQLAEIISEAKEEKVKVLFVQPQFSKASATSVAEAIGGVVVPVNPLSEDYINNLKVIADKIAAGLSTQK